SDVDCGGSTSCMRCATNGACTAGTDCASGVCNTTSHACQAPSCTDGVTNGLESGIDCGGTSTCARCGTGLGCTMGIDCQSGVCNGTTCAAPICTDNVKNGTETDVDCGGSCAPSKDCADTKG